MKMQNLVKLANCRKALAIDRLVSQATSYISLRKVIQEEIERILHPERSPALFMRKFN